MFGRKNKNDPNVIALVARTDAALRNAKTIVEIDEIGSTINSGSFPSLDDRAYLAKVYNHHRQQLGAEIKTGPAGAPAPKPEDTRDLFTRNLDSMGGLLASWLKKREYLESEIARLSEELFQVNVSVDAVETARQMILDQRGPSREAPTPVDEETEAFEAASEAIINEALKVATAAENAEFKIAPVGERGPVGDVSPERPHPSKRRANYNDQAK